VNEPIVRIDAQNIDPTGDLRSDVFMQQRQSTNGYCQEQQSLEKLEDCNQPDAEALRTAVLWSRHYKRSAMLTSDLTQKESLKC